MLNLRSIVQSLPRLAKALEGSRAQLLQIIAEVNPASSSCCRATLIECTGKMISDERLYKIDELVRASLNDEAAPAKV